MTPGDEPKRPKRPVRRPTNLDDTRLTELRDEELAWLAALATSARGLQPSLREFLRER